MKKLNILALTIIFFVAMSGCATSQGRDSRTRSAQAAYGYPDDFRASKKKAQKARKAAGRKGQKSRAQYRKKSPWVN